MSLHNIGCRKAEFHTGFNASRLRFSAEEEADGWRGRLVAKKTTVAMGPDDMPLL